MNAYITFLVGVLFAAAGGEIFVRGAVGLAGWLRVAPGIIGATVAAFATSSPELAVSISAAVAGTPQIALGDALGSNVVNVALILGMATVFAPIRSPRDSIRRDFPVALVVPMLTALLIVDGLVSRIDAILLLTMFSAWFLAVLHEARRQRSSVGAIIGEHSGVRAAISCVIGMVLLVLAGQFIVAGAGEIAQALGIDAFIVGAVIVAIGTSVPELATTVIATLRGHHEIGLGTILGSNIFNGLFIVGIAGSITPITAAWNEVAITLAAGILAVAIMRPGQDGVIDRRRGVLLLMLYMVYIGALIQV